MGTAYHLCAGPDTFAGSGEDVVAAILRHRDAPERRRHIGGEGELTQLRDALGETRAPA